MYILLSLIDLIININAFFTQLISRYFADRFYSL